MSKKQSSKAGRNAKKPANISYKNSKRWEINKNKRIAKAAKEADKNIIKHSNRSARRLAEYTRFGRILTNEERETLIKNQDNQEALARIEAEIRAIESTKNNRTLDAKTDREISMN